MKAIPILAVLFLGIVTAGAMAFPGMNKNEEIQDAIENNDIEAWKEAAKTMMEQKIDSMTQEDFERMRERYSEMQERKAEHQEKMQPFKEALENRDYDAWMEALEGMDKIPKHAQGITEENFDTFVALHEAKEAGDYETVKQLSEELGFKHPNHGKTARMRWGR